MLTGSISCYKSAYIISKLIQNDFEVQTAATSSALKFLGEGTLEGLTGKAVFKDVFSPGQMMGHIDFCKWADLAIICPATAGTINGLATGTAHDPVGSLFLAYDLRKPFIVAPAMNQQMFKHPATQASLEKLKGWDIRVLPVDEGPQACGDEGPGRLLDPDKIYQAIVGELGR
jgi:phosphopantothenoylcysteine decarboxylase/phosphopantothenate--cysteine ligase